jgi:hypothetical protein
MILNIKIQPNAKKNEISEKTDECWKIKIKAPAVENKANQELIKFLAKEFNVTKKDVQILHGEKNKLKVVEIKIEK